MTNKEHPIGRLKIEAIRKVFPREAQDFTTWLESHIEALSERVGIELLNVEREKEVGDFNLDLLCEDAQGRKVIIENQLERTDHDHLGKVLTYLVNLEASTAVWVTPKPRQEHQKVIDWLNGSTGPDLSFYLVKVEAVRIGESPFAPLFTVLAGPEKQAKIIGKEKKEWAETDLKRLEFWKGLLEKSKDKTNLFSNISPGPYNWIGTGAGKSGVLLVYLIWMECGGIELYIDHDQDTGEKNKAIFDALYVEKESIEKEFGKPLEWQRLDDKRASRIRKRFEKGGLALPESWSALQDEMIDAMIHLDKALGPRLAKIRV